MNAGSKRVGVSTEKGCGIVGQGYVKETGSM